jgi:hypothetical protein
VIYDDKRRDRSKLLERYNEGSDVFLVCEVTGGEYADLINCTKKITLVLLSLCGDTDLRVRLRK